ncbi:PIN domain-containing protein [Pseudomonas sp. LF-5]|uniref:PIN domain-containing protein n=1 Tax=Pseudomonas sp. LF-5 TaxID=3031121 RepID=UPI00309A76C6
MTGDVKPKVSAATKDDLSLTMWQLEDAFPDVTCLLHPTVLQGPSKNELIVLDTNVLLLPFIMGGRQFGAIKSTFKKLAEEERLFVPGRVIREFLSNRDRKIADILKGVETKANGVHNAMINLPDFFEDHVEALPALNSIKKLREASNEYAESLHSLIKSMKAWRGNDPVSLAYREIFVDDVVVDPEFKRTEVEKAWKIRLASKIPPGYKDGGKLDTGIGDFLIWLSILEIGKKKNQDLIFVTGEEKADWRVRSNSKGVYLRPELIDEYRRHSNGRSLELLSLGELLSRAGVEEEVVSAVKDAEASVTASDSLILDYNEDIACFNYSTYDGELLITVKGKGDFNLKFSKASNERIHVYADSGTAVARARHVPRDQAIEFESFDSSSRVYTIGVAEIFLVKNADGSILAAKIMEIKDDTRGFDEDGVTFIYRTFAPGVTIRVP